MRFWGSSFGGKETGNSGGSRIGSRRTGSDPERGGTRARKELSCERGTFGAAGTRTTLSGRRGGGEGIKIWGIEGADQVLVRRLELFQGRITVLEMVSDFSEGERLVSGSTVRACTRTSASSRSLR